MRYALMALAISGCLFLLWRAWLAFPEVIQPPDPYYSRDTGNDVLFGLLVASALAMALAAFGMIRRHAWGAYLFSAAAFPLSVPLAFLLLLSAIPPASATAWERLLVVGLLVLVLSIGVLGLRLGRSLRRLERA
jgi:hypothetical protein